jgi:hypothetical protein
MNTKENNPPQAHDITLRALQLKALYLGTTLAVPALLDPNLPILQHILKSTGRPTSSDIDYYIGGNESSNEKIAFSSRQVLTTVSQLRGEVVSDDMLASSMLLGAVRIGDMIQKSGLSSTQAPLLQFARHFRNACAHGDIWEIRNSAIIDGKLKHPARLRELEITPDLNGKRATMKTVHPKLYVEFLDDIAKYFMPDLHG